MALTPAVDAAVGQAYDNQNASLGTTLDSSSQLTDAATQLMEINTESTIQNMQFTQSINNHSEANKTQASGVKKQGETLGNASRFTA
jgi:hypothetical protein